MLIAHLTRLRAGLALLAVPLLLLGGACGESEGELSLGATGDGVTVSIPSDWFSRDTPERGVVVAASSDDLEAGVPSGPRLTVQRASNDLPDPTELLAGAGEEVSVGEPEEVRVAGQDAVAIESRSRLDGTEVVSRTIVVGMAEGVAWEVIAEAPAAVWNDNRALFDKMVDTIFIPEG